MDAQNPEPTEDQDGGSVAEMINRIKIGGLDPTALTKDQRQLCVEALYFESGSTSGIALFLKVSDRTVRRDLEDIRARNALDPDPELARRLVGDFLHAAAVHRANLMKLARQSGASVAERSQAEYQAYLVLSDSTAKLQSLGYLPKSTDSLRIFDERGGSGLSPEQANLISQIEEMARLEDDPAKAQKLLSLKETVQQEEPKDEPKAE